MSEEEIAQIFGDDMFDPYSKEYQKTKAENISLVKVRQDPLIIALSEASHLDDDTRNRYIYLAEKYCGNMKENLFKNQFELNQDYPDVSKDEWNDFVNDRIVSVYINKHKRTMLKAAAEDNLVNPIAKNKRDNLQLIKDIEEKEQNEQNKNICIIRIPDIYDE